MSDSSKSSASKQPPEDPLTEVELNTSISGVEREIASSVREPVKEHAAKLREKVRTRVTYWIIGFALVLAGALAGRYLWQGETQDAVANVFTPIIGLAGVVLGFYFGGKDSTS